MNADAPLRQVLASDLFVATGRRGLRAGLAALVFEPGFATVFGYRICTWLYRRGWCKTAKLLWRLNVMSSSCHLHLEAWIEPGLMLPHPAGIVVGSEARVGANVTLYQGVTLGRGRDAGYPTLCDDVIVYPGAILIGGITVGRGAVIGAGSVVLRDVVEGAVMAGNPARELKRVATASDQQAACGQTADRGLD